MSSESVAPASLISPEPSLLTTPTEAIQTTEPAATLLTTTEPAPTPEFVPYTTETLAALLPEAPAPVLELFNKHKLGSDTIKDLAAYQTTLQQDAAKATADAWAEQNQKWQTETKSHPEFGGPKLDAKLAEVKTLVTEYGDKSFSEMLSITGAGNHPAMIGFLLKLSAALPGEPSPVVGSPAISERSLAERIFNNGANQ